MELEKLSLDGIAGLIAEDWKNPSRAARPYLEAMMTMLSINDMFIAERGSMVVACFLSNARNWRGPKAQEIKKELQRRLRHAS